MDLCETLALEHLSARFPGGGRIKYEPRGRCTTPDFSIDDSIAVEVTLMTAHGSGNPPRPLMESATPFMNTLRAFANSLTSSPARSLFVYVDFGRPIPSPQEVRTLTRAYLEELIGAADPVGMTRAFGSSLSMTCLQVLPLDRGRTFVFGWADREAGGTPLPIMKRNVHLCVERKWDKVAPHRSGFDQWWLLLMDYVSFTSDYERDGIREYLALEHRFDKVLLVDPTEPAVCLEL